MGAERSEEELKARATEALEALALATGARGHIWMVIKGDGGKIGGCSPSLRPYGAALMDEVEKAVEKPVTVTSKREASGMLKAEKVLHTLAKTKHVELHPIVATMVQGLNEINNHKVPRVMALTDPSTMPKWFPFPPEVYAPRAQKMDLHQLFHVMDVIFGEIRGNLHSIQTMHGMLDRVYKSGSCSIGTRAGIDSFFEFLEDEALGGSGGVVKQESDPPPASESSGVGREDEDEAEARSRKRNRNADVPRSLPRASPANSSANSTQVLEDEIDFEKYMSEEGGQFLAEFEALTRLPETIPPFLDPPNIMVTPNMSDVFEANGSAVDPPPWNFPANEYVHSGQSTLATGSDPGGAFQVASGEVGSTPTSSRHWTPEWYEDGAHPQPLLQPNESLVLARLRQQMAREGFPNPPPLAAELKRDDGLSESMRWDFLPQQRGSFAVGGDPVLRQAGLAMARAPSFSPAPSINARAFLGAPAVPPQALKASTFLQKAKVLITPKTNGSPKTAKSKGGAAEPFPQFRGAVDPPAEAKSGELKVRRASADSGRQLSGGVSHQGSGDQEALGLDCAGPGSGKALKVLGIDDSGSFSDSRSVPGSLDESGSVDEEEAGGKKGLARFLKLGRNKTKANNKSPKDEDQPAAFSGELLALPRGLDSGPFFGGGGDVGTPLESCEAFPFRREVERFDSFASDKSAPEADSDGCERFPFQRSAAESETVDRKMHRLSVSEGFHTELKRGLSASGNASLPEYVSSMRVAPPSAAKQLRAEWKPSAFAEGSQNGTSSPEGAAVSDEEEERAQSPAFALGLGGDDEEVDYEEDIEAVRPGLPKTPQMVPAEVAIRKPLGSGGLKSPTPADASTRMPPAIDARGPSNNVHPVKTALAQQYESPEDEDGGDLAARLQKLRVQATS